MKIFFGFFELFGVNAPAMCFNDDSADEFSFTSDSIPGRVNGHVDSFSRAVCVDAKVIGDSIVPIVFGARKLAPQLWNSEQDCDMYAICHNVRWVND